MKLLTKAIETKLRKIGINPEDETKLRDKEVVVKFFDPCGSWTWFVLEGEEIDGDWIFFGLVDGHEKELGSFSLRELESVKGPLGIGIERDLHFTGKIPDDALPHWARRN